MVEPVVGRIAASLIITRAMPGTLLVVEYKRKWAVKKQSNNFAVQRITYKVREQEKAKPRSQDCHIGIFVLAAKCKFNSIGPRNGKCLSVFIL